MAIDPAHRKFFEHVLKQYAKLDSWFEYDDSHMRANALVILCTRAANCRKPIAALRRGWQEGQRLCRRVYAF